VAAVRTPRAGRRSSRTTSLAANASRNVGADAVDASTTPDVGGVAHVEKKVVVEARVERTPNEPALPRSTTSAPRPVLAGARRHQWMRPGDRRRRPTSGANASAQGGSNRRATNSTSRGSRVTCDGGGPGALAQRRSEQSNNEASSPTRELATAQDGEGVFRVGLRTSQERRCSNCRFAWTIVTVARDSGSSKSPSNSRTRRTSEPLRVFTHADCRVPPGPRARDRSPSSSARARARLLNHTLERGRH